MAAGKNFKKMHFQSEKARVLAKADLSRKGSVDEPIRELVEYINSQDSFYTTSSCSGRVTVFSEVCGRCGDTWDPIFFPAYICMHIGPGGPS